MIRAWGKELKKKKKRESGDNKTFEMLGCVGHVQGAGEAGKASGEGLNVCSG
jgi:hypothetical protein